MIMKRIVASADRACANVHFLETSDEGKIGKDEEGIGRNRQRERQRERDTMNGNREEGRDEGLRHNVPRFERRTWGVDFGGGRAWTGELTRA